MKKPLNQIMLNVTLLFYKIIIAQVTLSKKILIKILLNLNIVEKYLTKN
jgi:hypothetical protein